MIIKTDISAAVTIIMDISADVTIMIIIITDSPAAPYHFVFGF